MMPARREAPALPLADGLFRRDAHGRSGTMPRRPAGPRFGLLGMTFQNAGP